MPVILKHIKQKYGQEICHRYLHNECTAKRCLFTHRRPTNSSGSIRAQEGRALVPTSTDFNSHPTAGPAVCSQEVSQGPKAPTVPRLSIEARNKIKNMTAHMIESQMKDMLPHNLAAVSSALNLTPL